MDNDGQKMATPLTGRSKLVLALTIGLALGAGAGSLVVGPLIADPVDVQPLSDEEVEARCAALFEEWGMPSRAPAPAVVHTIENVVLNPAGSEGTRFLLASVAFGMREAAGGETMAARDTEARDIVIRVLGSRSVAELSNSELRESLKDEMRSEVALLVGPTAILDVYFPRFVIQ